VLIATPTGITAQFTFIARFKVVNLVSRTTRERTAIITKQMSVVYGRLLSTTTKEKDKINDTSK